MVVNGAAARSVVCGLTVWTGHLGVNFIFATLIVRMIRISYIFNHVGRIGRLWSDRALFGMVLAVIGFDALLLLTWSVADPYITRDDRTYVSTANPPYYRVDQFCYSKRTQIWLLLIFGEIGILLTAAVILAVKTRKIEQGNFKDTKKVSAYVFMMIMTICLVIPLWWTLRLAKNSTGRGTIISLGYLAAAVYCQVFLVVPKIYPALLRRFQGRVVFSYSTSSTKSTQRSTRITFS